MLTADQLLLTFWRRKVAFLLTFTVTLAAMAAMTFSLSKVYVTSAYIFVGSSRNSGSDYEATQTNQVVLKTYSELLQARSVAEQVAEGLPFPMAPSAIEAAVSVAPISQSQLIRIGAEAGDPGRARTLANTYARVFVARAAELAEETGGKISVTVAEPAALVEQPARPRPRLYLAVGATLAAALAAAVALLRDRLDQRLVIDRSMNELLGLPILARIPEQSASAIRALARADLADDEDTVLAESFGLLLTNIVFAASGRVTQSTSIAVVSAGEGEGKSTCCLGLARAVVSHDLDVLLVDGDLRRRQLSTLVGLQPDDEDGLSYLLTTSPEVWRAAVVGTEIQPGLRVLAAGPHPAKPASLLSGSIHSFERWASRAHAAVVFDTPPVSIGADASLIGSAVEDVLLVVNVRTANRAALTQTVEQLKRVRANVIGVVLNRTDPADGPTAYYGARAPRSSPADVRTPSSP